MRSLDEDMLEMTIWQEEQEEKKHEERMKFAEREELRKQLQIGDNKDRDNMAVLLDKVQTYLGNARHFSARLTYATKGTPDESKYADLYDKIDTLITLVFQYRDLPWAQKDDPEITK